MSKPHYITAADLFDHWRDDVLTSEPPTLWPIGEGELARIEIGPGLVTLIGGPPGAGKTAFCMQAVVDPLRLTPTLRALVVNVEMPPAKALGRQAARLTGIAAGAVGRTKDSKERSTCSIYGLNLASFRESSGLEFSTDGASS